MTDKRTNTSYVTLKGKANWAQVFRQNRDLTGPEGAWELKDEEGNHIGGACKVEAIIPRDELDKLVEVKSLVATNLLKRIKEAKVILANPDDWDEGDIQKATKTLENSFEGDDYVVKLKRLFNAPYSYGGAPQVVHADTSPWDIDEDGLIGNGSECMFYVSVYKTKAGNYGTRLDGVQVLSHVPYESDSDGESQGGLKFVDYSGSAAPKPKATRKKASKKEDPRVVDDEIPF